ncbi:Cfr10I/Bse634I family restriction endonuclease [Plectonema radiosum NIES-515]|uniref:Cfr10I/Bse634I family restriction endonuclease n=1 Tax=Plectonema radiosum NIES-515 TaxID=2986073 RepID=A0ABT3AVT0_9CYAN|nr:Cfr10I/Bse634I family restriction endonuclease [Plectonema radiosum]MCV3213232.1 Cfr10I/Bse634I family restriction endonuclease [Plectonema radiosum NIES-515]
MSVSEILGWIRNETIKAFTAKYLLPSADRTIFNTAIAPHGVALEQNFKLVDGTYPYTRKADLVPLVAAAIKQ